MNAPANQQKTMPAPEPLPGLLPVMPFDYELLPFALRDWCRDISERMQCPPDYVAVGMMVTAGAVLGRKVGIRPQRHTPWTEVGNIWGVIIGRPGMLKTPALDDACAPLDRLIAAAQRDYELDRKQYEQGQRLEELRRQALDKKAKDRLKKDPEADLTDLITDREQEPPTLMRYKSNDPSPAALGELLRVNPNGIMVFRDELVSLFRQLDKEDNAEGRGFYLTGWGGNSAYTFDRIGRGLNLHLPAVCVSVLGGTQPGRLATYINEAVKGGGADDGLLQRFGLLVWPNDNHTWQNIDRPVNRTAKNAAFAAFDHLEKLEPAGVGAQQDQDHNGDPEGIPYLRFDDEALAAFLEWRTDLENNKLRGDEHPAVISHLAKYRKLVPSIALLCHLLDRGRGPVSVHAVLRSLAWAEYLETHVQRAYGSVTRPAVDAGKAILGKIQSGALTPPFTAREIYRRGWAGLSDKDTVESGISILLEYKHLYFQHVGNKGGGPKQLQYFLNPAKEGSR